jgi:hypothetical protein
LLNAKVDNSGNGIYDSLGLGSYGKILDIYNRFDYGFAGGFEVYPVKGLLIGARINYSLSQLYKQPEQGQQPGTGFSSIDAKNNVIQIYAGWRFGKKKK